MLQSCLLPESGVNFDLLQLENLLVEENSDHSISNSPLVQKSPIGFQGLFIGFLYF